MLASGLGLFFSSKARNGDRVRTPGYRTRSASELASWQNSDDGPRDEAQGVDETSQKTRALNLHPYGIGGEPFTIKYRPRESTKGRREGQTRRRAGKPSSSGSGNWNARGVLGGRSLRGECWRLAGRGSVNKGEGTKGGHNWKQPKGAHFIEIDLKKNGGGEVAMKRVVILCVS